MSDSIETSPLAARPERIHTGRPPRPANKIQAKRLLVEILRQANAGIPRSFLTQTFWLAHLYYARSHHGYLSDWPILRAPGRIRATIRPAW